MFSQVICTVSFLLRHFVLHPEDLNWNRDCEPHILFKYQCLTLLTLQNEWAQIPTETLQNFIKSLPKRLKDLKARKGEPTSH